MTFGRDQTTTTIMPTREFSSTLILAPRNAAAKKLGLFFKVKFSGIPIGGTPAPQNSLLFGYFCVTKALEITMLKAI
jgi:hypothetical protein